MNKTLWFAAMFGLVACSNDGKGDSGADGGGDGGSSACDIQATNFLPGDASAHYRDDIGWTLSAADASASISLSDSGGTDVGGSTWTADDGKVYFTPDSPLTPSTSYTSVISFCDGGGSESHDFSTSDVGTPVSCDLTGRGYRVALGQANFVEPAALGGLIGSLLEQDILLGVEAVADTELTMLGAISVDAGGKQDYCNPSIAFPPAEFSNPTVQIGPQDTTIDAAGVQVTINGLEMTGDFAPDCSYFGGGTLSGELDARDLAVLLADLTGSEDPAVACSTLEGFGVTCGPCASDGEPFCVSIVANQITAESDADSTVECVPDVDCHTSCPDAGGVTACEC